MLYRPEDFEPLTDEPWDEDRIRAGIREIVDDTDAALRGPKLLWRADDWDRWRATSPLKDALLRRAGVLWALDDLRRARPRGDDGWISRELALARARAPRGRDRLLASWTDVARAERESALLTGETGILLVAFRLAPSQRARG